MFTVLSLRCKSLYNIIICDNEQSRPGDDYTFTVREYVYRVRVQCVYLQPTAIEKTEKKKFDPDRRARLPTPETISV